MPNGVLNGDVGNILNFLSAAAGLGAAAMGLVDASKAFFGGPSNFGFGYIKEAIGHFLFEAPGGPLVFGKAEILRTLRSNWMNGVAMADQNAKAKSLIHLGLTQSNAGALAAAAGVDATKLTSLVQKTANGTKPDPDEINVLGQFDVVLSAVLDAAYERADQKYRNTCKLLAMLVAIGLSVIGGWLIYGSGQSRSLSSYFGTLQFGLSAIVGLLAAPLAPVAKNLSTSLQSAVAAVRAAKQWA